MVRIMKGQIWIMESMMEDFNWWMVSAALGDNTIQTHIYVIEIFSEVSLSGWGSYCNNSSALQLVVPETRDCWQYTVKEYI